MTGLIADFKKLYIENAILKGMVSVHYNLGG